MQGDAHSCGSMPPSSTNPRRTHAQDTRPFWSYQTKAMLQRACMWHLTLMLPKLHRRLHQAATGKAIQGSTHGKHSYLCGQDLFEP